MQRLLFLFVAAFSFVAATAQTADEVINKYITAAGGKEKLEGITTLQYVQAMSFPTPQGNMEMNLITVKEKGKLFRNQLSNDMIGESYSLITDTSAWVKKPANPFTGDEGGLEKLKPEDMKGIGAAQLDCAGFFPELVNYSAKGYTAELTGDKKVNGRDSYKLKLKKDKAETIFFIDKETGLVNAYTLKGEAVAAMGGMMGGTGAQELTIDFSNYQEVNGVKIPGVMKITTMMGEMSIPIKDVKINEVVDAKWYKAE